MIDHIPNSIWDCFGARLREPCSPLKPVTRSFSCRILCFIARSDVVAEGSARIAILCNRAAFRDSIRYGKLDRRADHTQ